MHVAASMPGRPAQHERVRHIAIHRFAQHKVNYDRGRSQQAQLPPVTQRSPTLVMKPTPVQGRSNTRRVAERPQIAKQPIECRRHINRLRGLHLVQSLLPTAADSVNRTHTHRSSSLSGKKIASQAPQAAPESSQALPDPQPTRPLRFTRPLGCLRSCEANSTQTRLTLASSDPQRFLVSVSREYRVFDYEVTQKYCILVVPLSRPPYDRRVSADPHQGSARQSRASTGSRFYVLAEHILFHNRFVPRQV